jgi:hypothetical protein
VNGDLIARGRWRREQIQQAAEDGELSRRAHARRLLVSRVQIPYNA